MNRRAHATRGSDVVLYAILAMLLLAGLAVFLVNLHYNIQSRELSRQHREACTATGRSLDECCRIGGAWVCPLADRGEVRP